MEIWARMNLPVLSSGGGVRSSVDGGAVRPVSAPVTACGGGGVWSSLGAQCGLGEESEREGVMNGTVRRKGIPRGLFIGEVGPLTARINCARPERAPGYVAHVRVVCGVTVASCNGHIVGYGV